MVTQDTQHYKTDNQRVNEAAKADTLALLVIADVMSQQERSRIAKWLIATAAELDLGHSDVKSTYRLDRGLRYA